MRLKQYVEARRKQLDTFKSNAADEGYDDEDLTCAEWDEIFVDFAPGLDGADDDQDDSSDSADDEDDSDGFVPSADALDE
jgi:hypothetical protein